jgi:hypothetical protein
MNPPGFGGFTAGSRASTSSAFFSGQAPTPTELQPTPLPPPSQYELEAAQVQRLDDQMKLAEQARRDAVLNNAGSGFGATATTTIVSSPKPLASGLSQ